MLRKLRIIRRRFDDSLILRESSRVGLVRDVGVKIWSGMVIGVMDNDCSLLAGWLGVDWVGCLGRVDDEESGAVVSRRR